MNTIRTRQNITALLLGTFLPSVADAQITVDDAQAFRRCLDLGCRMVTTNRPGRFVSDAPSQR